MGTDEFRPGGEHAATLIDPVARDDPAHRAHLTPQGFFVAASFGSMWATGPKVRLWAVHFEHRHGLLLALRVVFRQPEQKGTAEAAFGPERDPPLHTWLFMYSRTARSR